MALALLTACPAGKTPSREVRVLAAASLQAPLSALGAAFEARTPGVKVALSFGSSTAQERQVEAGAPCDLYVAASLANVDRLAAASLVDSASRVIVARNELVAIVPEGAAPPADLHALALLPRIAVGARGVPAGEYAREVLQGVVGEERLAGYPDEPAVVTAVAMGGAPAGICYASSLVSHPRHAEVARALALDTSRDPILYPAVLARAAREPALARALLDFLRSDEGKAAFTKHGFLE